MFFRLCRDFFKSLIVLCLLVGFSPVLAYDPQGPLHFSAQKQIWDRKNNLVNLLGEANVSQFSEHLLSDKMKLDLKNRILDAWGSCVFTLADQTMIHSDELHFDLDERTGLLVRGRITNDKFFVRGSLIEKRSANRFILHDATYTTCKDCAPSWSLIAKYADLELQGYGYFEDLTIMIKGSPLLWLPAMVVPLKTKRQSGLLFPRFGYSKFNGFQFVIPFFLALDKSADMTLGFGSYSSRGPRFEWEGRYASNLLGGYGKGQSRFYFQKDQLFRQNTMITGNRWALAQEQLQKIGSHFYARAELNVIGDNLYPFYFPEDSPNWRGKAFLPSSLSLTGRSGVVGVMVGGLQNYFMLNSSQLTDRRALFLRSDPRGVQMLPVVRLQLFDQPVFPHWTLGAKTEVIRFSRAYGFYDSDSKSLGEGLTQFQPGTDPIRKAWRAELSPKVTTTFLVGRWFYLQPSVEAKTLLYHFPSGVNDLWQAQVLVQTQIGTQLEKRFNGKNTIAKHLIRPQLTYSLMPYRSDNREHPFVSQIANGASRGTYGYYFDYKDLASYSVVPSAGPVYPPMGHSVRYGFVSQWVEKNAAFQLGNQGARTAVEFSVNQMLNLLQFYSPSYIDERIERKIFAGRLTSDLALNLERVLGTVSYAYDPQYFVGQRHTFATSMTTIFERAVHQRLLSFERSLTVGYTYNYQTAQTSNINAGVVFSVNDTILPQVSFSYSFEEKKLFGANFNLIIQSPSICWRLSTGVAYRAGVDTPQFSLDLGINLSGSGFDSLTEMPQSFGALQENST